MEKYIIASTFSVDEKVVLLYLNHVFEIFNEYEKFSPHGFTPVMVFEKEAFLANSYDLALLNKKFFTPSSIMALKNYHDFLNSFETTLTKNFITTSYSSVSICPNEGANEKKQLINLLEKTFSPHYERYCALVEKFNLDSKIDEPKNISVKIKL